MTPTLTNPETRRRLALGLITAPVSRNHRRRHPMTWLLAAAIGIPSIAAIIICIFR
jgi:hypothetical protein